MALFIPTYFAPIAQYAMMYQTGFDNVTFELEDNFQKQTYRNRCYIYGANGKLSLNVPIKHKTKVGRKKTKDALIENNFPWQQQHFKSLQAAYRSSPFFEFFEADLYNLFQRKHTDLQELNLDTHDFIADALDLSKDFSRTSAYHITDDHKEDYRNLALAKNAVSVEMDPYVQIFDDKFGFISNLSILDLLFMEGPNSVSFLEKISLILT